MTGQRTITLQHLAERFGLSPATAGGAVRVAAVSADCICLHPDPGAEGCLRCGGTVAWAPTLRARFRRAGR